jgi:hypothetical protein
LNAKLLLQHLEIKVINSVGIILQPITCRREYRQLPKRREYQVELRH